MQSVVTIQKLVHGGQGLATLDDGKKVFVWGALPGETVRITITKKRSDHAMATADEILRASSDRVRPLDPAYMSTSPWQIMTYVSENEHKKSILAEAMTREGISVNGLSFHAPKSEWHYRNKMEYSFYGDEQGLHLALFNRGSHRKQIVEGSSIAMPQIDKVARVVRDQLEKSGVRASSLKTLVLRANQDGEVVCALYVRDEGFSEIAGLKNVCKGLVVTYSNPKSPASVRTNDLYQYGDIALQDSISGVDIAYDVFSFFQVNIDAFHLAMADIERGVGDDQVIDLYSGVGTIGLALGKTARLVESDPANVQWARINAKKAGVPEVIHTTSENALEHLDEEHTVIVDPPRAGLHQKLVDQLCEVVPPKIIYLSCNPSTQARDLKLLSEKYQVQEIIGYNFFPRTPHIESLAVLIKK